MVALNHGHMMRHALMAKFLEPFARIRFHSHQTVRGHQMASRPDRLAFARRYEIFSVEPPEAENGDGQAVPNRRLDDGRLFDVEMTRDARAARLAHRFAKRHRRGAAMPDRDRFLVM